MVLVNFPVQTIKSPVAKGSKVPAWPILNFLGSPTLLIKWYFNLSEESGDEIINIYLEAPPTDRITRMLKRTDNDIEKINEVIRRFNADEEDFKEFENSDSIKKVVSNYIYYKIDNKTFWGSQEVLEYIEIQTPRYLPRETCAV